MFLPHRCVVVIMASGGSNSEYFSVDILTNNSPETFLDVSELLIRFANNILKDPHNVKYRKIRVGNPIVQSRLLPVEGAIECLFEMGFEEDGDFFTYPEKCALDDLRGIRDTLDAQRKKLKLDNSGSTQKNPPIQPPVNLPQASGGASGGPSVQRPHSGLPQSQMGIMMSEANVFKKLKSSLEQVMIYEDPNLQRSALACIPSKQLLELANEKLQRHLSTSGSDGPITDLKDFLLLELLSWFKAEFFQWVNAPPCDFCQSQTSGIGGAQPTSQELAFGAGRVELYKCNTCARQTRFPRYNHPGKLLETRRGRCGEWANCFTLCCRAMGFEARYVLDWTDHVWTEVYSQAKKRWLHCDPCENSCDKPLLYEAGWGKKLSYVIAFSCDDIQDVTWRYSNKHQEVRSRRNECRETWLVQTILKLRKQKQAALPEARKKELQERLVVEISEFLTAKSASEDEVIGRQSGSTEWRQARGEMGNKASVAPKQTVIKPTAEEIQSKKIHLKYSCAKDCYVRESNENEKVYGWESMVYEAVDLFRKEELDWNMVYLARREGTHKASVSWKLDFSEAGLVVDRVEVVAVDTACYEDGQVLWRMCAGDVCAMLPQDQAATVIDSVQGCDNLSITADLRRGKGDVAWQHTQLFRQGIRDYDHYPLNVIVHLRQK